MNYLWRKHALQVCLGLATTFLFCEYAIYYIVLAQCFWPTLNVGRNYEERIKVLLLGDPHLLGPRLGNWFDKLRREHQMAQAFATAVFLHRPDFVFILGDIFDEGKWINHEEFEEHLVRFRTIFSYGSNSSQLRVIVGNHDIGFHYQAKARQELYRRFEQAFGESVELFTARKNIFVLINSMAMEGDGCEMCSAAVTKLNDIAKTLNCAKNPQKWSRDSCGGVEKVEYSRPIVLTHFPLYRKSEASCSGFDAPPPSERNVKHRQKYDVLSEEASQEILSKLEPRLVFTAHTHHGCHIMHPGGISEWTVASFSWRNRNNPLFFMLTLTPDHHSVAKCFLPEETMVYFSYFVGALLIVVWKARVILKMRKKNKFS